MQIPRQPPAFFQHGRFVGSRFAHHLLFAGTLDPLGPLVERFQHIVKLPEGWRERPFLRKPRAVISVRGLLEPDDHNIDLALDPLRGPIAEARADEQEQRDDPDPPIVLQLPLRQHAAADFPDQHRHGGGGDEKKDHIPFAVAKQTNHHMRISLLS